MPSAAHGTETLTIQRSEETVADAFAWDFHLKLALNVVGRSRRTRVCSRSVSAPFELMMSCRYEASEEIGARKNLDRVVLPNLGIWFCVVGHELGRIGFLPLDLNGKGLLIVRGPPARGRMIRCRTRPPQ